MDCDQCGYDGPHTLVVEGDRTTWRCAECDRVVRRERRDAPAGLRSRLSRSLRRLLPGGRAH